MMVYCQLFVFPLLALLLPVFLLNSPFKRNALWFFLCLHLIYLVWVPVTDRILNFNSFFGFSLPWSVEMDSTICGIYVAASLAFWCGYLLSNNFQPGLIQVKAKTRLKFNGPSVFKTLTILQILVWILILFNINASGISLAGLLNPSNQNENEILFSIAWKHPWIDLLSNVLPVCLFLQWYYKPKPSLPWFMLLGFWLIFSLLGGWRYRLILFLLFMGLGYLQTHTIKWKLVFPVLVFLGFSMAWLTLNRMAIAKRQFDLITFDLRQFDLGILNTEFSNSRTFRASLSYMEKNNISHPRIESWTNFVSNKFQKKDSFPNGIRPKPWILEITKAWIPPGWPWNPNPAVSQLEEFYLTFGWFGMVFCMILVGIWVHFLDRITDNSLFLAGKIVCIALLFQWVSRGFFLFQLQITLVCLLPFLVLILLRSYLYDDSEKDPIGSV